MDMVHNTLKNWKVWLPCVWFWGNIFYLVFLTLGTLASIYQGQVGPKKINRILKRWVTVALLLLLRELLEPLLTQLEHTWLLLAWLGTLSFLENLKSTNSVIYEHVIEPFLTSREQIIDLFLHRFSFHYLEWKTALLQIVAYCSSEILRRTAHYLVADTELSRKLSSLETSGDHIPSPQRGIYEQRTEKKFLPSSFTEVNNFASLLKKQEFLSKGDKDSEYPLDRSNSVSQPRKSFSNTRPYEKIHELRMLLKQQKSRRNSSVSEKTVV